MIKKYKKLNFGFTLVETLVAISIFSMSILGLLSILASSIMNTTYAKEKLIADYLAQEGIEYVRNMRDTSALYDVSGGQHGWDAFKSSLSSASCIGAGCYVNNMSLVACASGSCPSFLYDNTTGKYGYTSGTSSAYIRKIQAIQVNADDVRISSTVFWKQGSGTFNITFSEDLFNWIQ
jgi:Tfp pilus assembly protein PilV